MLGIDEQNSHPFSHGVEKRGLRFMRRPARPRDSRNSCSYGETLKSLHNLFKNAVWLLLSISKFYQLVVHPQLTILVFIVGTKIHSFTSVSGLLYAP